MVGGSLTQVYQPGKYIARFTAKGYGAYDGLLTISTNSMSGHRYDEILILELS